MTSEQILQLNQHLFGWRVQHPDVENVRTAYRQQVLKFSLSSMAMENEPVNLEQLAKLLRQPAH